MQVTFEEMSIIESVSQTHDGKLEVIKVYNLEDQIIKKKEVYVASNDRVTLSEVLDV